MRTQSNPIFGGWQYARSVGLRHRLVMLLAGLMATS